MLYIKNLKMFDIEQKSYRDGMYQFVISTVAPQRSLSMKKIITRIATPYDMKKCMNDAMSWDENYDYESQLPITTKYTLSAAFKPNIDITEHLNNTKSDGTELRSLKGDLYIIPILFNGNMAPIEKVEGVYIRKFVYCKLEPNAFITDRDGVVYKKIAYLIVEVMPGANIDDFGVITFSNLGLDIDAVRHTISSSDPLPYDSNIELAGVAIKDIVKPSYPKFVNEDINWVNAYAKEHPSTDPRTVLDALKAHKRGNRTYSNKKPFKKMPYNKD